MAHAIPGARETLKKLAARGLVRLDQVVLAPGVREGLGQNRPERLTPEQAAAVDVLHTAVDTPGFQPFLLHGVTGSGKTEVYLRAVERALERGRGSLVLVPEIALTPQLVGRFRSRFGGDVAVLHSALKDRERLFHWQALRKGTAADLIKMAMVAVQQWLDNERLATLMILQVHDELVFEAPEDEVQRVVEHLPRLMCDVAQLAVPLVAEVGVGPDWERAH